MNYIVLDIGGTSIKGGYFIDMKLVHLYSEKTNGKLGINAILLSLEKVINALNLYGNTHYICISSAGNIDPKKGECVYASDNLKGWTSFNIKKYIEEKYKIICFVENDCCMHLLSQINESNKDKSVFMMTLGTGVGSVLYKNSEIYYGDNFSLGKFQHFCVKENGLKCDCGEYGCAEKELSSTGLKIYIQNIFNKEISVKTVFSLYRNGNLKAKEIFDEYFLKLEKYINFINTLKVDEIIIGGGLIKSKDVFIKYLGKHSEIKYALHGHLAALYGGYPLIKRNLV